MGRGFVSCVEDGRNWGGLGRRWRRDKKEREKWEQYRYGSVAGIELHAASDGAYKHQKLTPQQRGIRGVGAVDDMIDCVGLVSGVKGVRNAPWQVRIGRATGLQVGESFVFQIESGGFVSARQSHLLPLFGCCTDGAPRRSDHWPPRS